MTRRTHPKTIAFTLGPLAPHSPGFCVHPPKPFSLAGAFLPPCLRSSSLHDRMRWAIAKIQYLLRRMDSKPTPQSTGAAATSARSLSTSLSISDELALSEQVHAILQTVPAIEPPLECLAPLLSPHIVAAVLQETAAPRPAFRFFIWASRRRHLRSWASHNRMISILREADGGFELAWESLGELKDHDVPISPPAFTVLISAYAASGMAEKAVESFGRMVEFGCWPNTFTYNALLQILINKGVSLLAMAVYNLMLKSDCRPNRATYNILIDGLCKEGKTEDGVELFTEMLQRGILPNTMICTVLLSSFCKTSRMDRASRLLDSMKENNYKPDAVTYNVLLSGLCKSGRIGEAFEHLRSFREDGFVLGLSGYSCLIDGLFRAGRFEQACRYYKEMLEENVAPDCVLYTIMMRGYSEVGRIDDAFSFLREMTERGIVPDTFCYNTLIKGLCDAGFLDRARTLRLEISQNDCFPDSATYTIMICGLCKEGLVHEAQQIFDEMGTLGCFPTVMTFNALINGLCKAGKLEEARILLYKMEMGKNPSLFLRLSQGANQVRDSNSLRRLVMELCESGLIFKAYKLLRDIIESGVVPDVVTYNILINGLCKVCNVDGALKLFKELQLKGHSADVVTYGTLIDGLLLVHREDDALMVFQYMLRSGCTPSLSIYSTFMRTLCRKKKIAQAVTLWLNHISQERSISGEAETIRAVRNHFEQGDLEEAVRGLVEMDRTRGSVNSFPYTIWIIGYCQARRIDEALTIFSILTEFNIDATPPSCVLLINCLCRQGKLASATDVMLYALRKGFLFEKPVGNRLIKKLCIHSKKDALQLACRMRLSGYDMDMYLRASNKALLYDQKAGGAAGLCYGTNSVSVSE